MTKQNRIIYIRILCVLSNTTIPNKDLNAATASIYTHTHVETMENNVTFYFLIFQAPLAVVSQILAWLEMKAEHSKKVIISWISSKNRKIW